MMRNRSARPYCRILDWRIRRAGCSAQEIASGAVRLVLRDYEPVPLSINAVHPAGRRLSTKVRVFVDFLAEAFAQEPSLAISTGH